MGLYVIAIVVILVVIGIWYLNTQAKIWHHPQHEVVVVQEKSEKQAFIPADKFQGSLPGYVYKMDANGLGYYIDYHK